MSLTLVLKDRFVHKIRKGYPWLTQEAFNKTIPECAPGTLVKLLSASKDFMGIGYINPLTKLCVRVLSLENIPIDKSFFLERLKAAFSRREARFDEPYYRLVHSEADNLPGLIIDRFNTTFVCQTNTAGMENLKSYWLEALTELFEPAAIFLKNDSMIRKKEGLVQNCELIRGEILSPLEVHEHGLSFFVDLLQGQKTGWFFDQRANRLHVASKTKNKTVLDLYSYCGGFGLQALAKGAHKVTFVDRSEIALHMATLGVEKLNKLAQSIFIKQEAFNFLDSCISQNQTFDVVIADPPAFIKNKMQVGAGLRGYQKLAKMCAQIVQKEGILAIASCSHHARTDEFQKNVELGITKAGRKSLLIHRSGADKDHPIHPFLPQTHYLKMLTYKLD